jgi:DNA-binding beta-propeller fold protein YncE
MPSMFPRIPLNTPSTWQWRSKTSVTRISETGHPPQLPAGMLTIITISSQAALADPSLWTSKDVPLTGLGDACRFPEDPEPEYVAIHPDNTKVVVTLQENNCNVLVDLATGAIIGAYDAGSVALQCIDLTEDDLVSQTEDTDVEGIFREPDGVTWIGETSFFATANEGDLDGGSRGFSIFNALDGNVIYDSGNTMELEVARIGHYPENRSENKGNEPENVLYAEANGRKFLFVASERSNLVFVYEVSDPTTPLLTQTLPVGTGPEGLAFVPDKNLLVVASEVDDRGDGIRSSISIFEIMRSDGPEYPTLVSVPRDGADEENGPFIPFSSLSGLSASNTDSNILYAVEDDSYTKNRVFTIDTSNLPSVITKEDRIFDGVGVLSACIDGKTGSTPLSDIINDDMTVNIDPEGIAVSADGGFWVVSEGIFKKNGDVKVPNFLLKLTQEACISECILLDDSFPTATEDGFVGVAEDGDEVVIAIQQAWDNEPNPRIAVYNTTSKTWKHAFYPLEVPASLNGGWVGLSDIASTGDGKFLVLERDNQSSADAKIKRISSIDLGDYSFADGVTLEKELYTDLIPHLSSTNGQIAEKVDGLAITSKGEVWISTNVGVGEQLLANVTPFKKNSKKAKKTKVKNSKKTKVKKTKEKKTAK